MSGADDRSRHAFADFAASSGVIELGDSTPARSVATRGDPAPEGPLVGAAWQFDALVNPASRSLFTGGAADGEIAVQIGFFGRQPAQLTPPSVERFRFMLGSIDPEFAAPGHANADAFEVSQVRLRLPDVGAPIELLAIANPEPASGVLFGAAVLGLVAVRRRRRSHQKPCG